MRTTMKLTLCLLAAWCAPVQAADLLDVLRVAQQQDPVFASAGFIYKAAKEKQVQGRALLLPSVNLSASTSYNDNSVLYKGKTLLPSGTSRYNSNGYNLTLTQPLYRPQNRLTATQAELQVLQAEAQFKLAQQDLILRVAQAYFDVLAAQDSVRLAEAQKTAIYEQLQQAKQHFAVGSATITDSYEAQARHDLINAQLLTAKSTLEIKQHALQQLTNTTFGNLLGAGSHLVLFQEPGGMEALVNSAERTSAAIAAASYALDMAQREAERARAGHAPTADLVASYGQNFANGGVTGVGSDSRNALLGVQVNLPIFQGGSTESKVREAAANLARTQSDLETVRRAVAQQIRQSYLAVGNGIGQIQALRSALKSSELMLQASKTGQEIGVRTTLDVLNAQQQLFATERELLQAEYTYLLNHLRLKVAMGNLEVDDLATINNMLH